MSGVESLEGLRQRFLDRADADERLDGAAAYTALHSGTLRWAAKQLQPFLDHAGLPQRQIQQLAALIIDEIPDALGITPEPWPTGLSPSHDGEPHATVERLIAAWLLAHERDQGQRTAALEKDALAMKTVIFTIGGQVEGRPTERVNYLQRLRQLLDAEQQLVAQGQRISELEQEVERLKER